MSDINLDIFNNLSSYEEYLIKCDLLDIKPNDERLLESKLFRKLDDEYYCIIIDGKSIVINKLTGKFEDNCSISKINSYAFENCVNLTSAIFPACTSIGYGSFYHCLNLTTVNFPVCMSIGYAAFYDCSNLTTANFPACISIRDGAFYRCLNLTTVNFPVCTNIERYAFFGCSNLKEITVKNGCKIGYNAIPKGCKINYV